MELIFKFTKEELQLITEALHIAAIHVDADEKADKINYILRMLIPFQRPNSGV